nr:synaptobrevin, longin-like domain protein [Tanacetum cinerariifolium]
MAFISSAKYSSGNEDGNIACVPTGSTKCSTADMGMKGKAVKPSACWFWKPSQNLSNKGPKNNSVSVMFKKYTYIDTQGRLNNTIVARLQFCDYHNMVAILEKSEHNIEFHPMVDFIKASPLRIITESSLRINLKLQDEEGISSLPDTELFKNLTLMGYNISPNQKFTFQKGQFFRQWKYLIHTIMQCISPKSAGFNEFSSNIAIALVCLATNRTYNFSKMIFDGLVKNVDNKISKFLMYPRFLTMCLRMTQFGQITPTQKYVGEGSGTPTEPHHTPSPDSLSPSHTTHTSPTIPPVTTTSIPTVTPNETTPIRQYTRRARISQSSALPTVVDEPDSPLRDVSQGETCPTDSGFIADQDRATIDKPSTLPHDSAPRVTFPAAVEGSMQQRIPELTVLCTSLQRQLFELTAKFQAQEVEIYMLKDRFKLLEDREGVSATRSGDDAPIKGRSMDEGEVATERISDDSEEMATVLTSMDAATVLPSRVVDVPTSIFATATVVTPYRRRKGKEVMVESETPKKQKVQEQIDAQVARELEEQLEREDQRRWKTLCLWAERIKRKGLNLEKESAKKQKTSEEVPEEAMSSKEVPKEKKLMHAPVDWRLYDTCGVHHVTAKDKEIFMLVKKDCPLRKGLALVMITYKLQVENYSQMANDLILKIYKIVNSPRHQGD